MATNYTTNYQLNQWEPADAVQRVDFNADNAKMDAALKSLSDQVIQKANQSAVNTLISAVNQKADTSTVSALSQAVAAKADQSALAAEIAARTALEERAGTKLIRTDQLSADQDYVTILLSDMDWSAWSHVYVCFLPVADSDTQYDGEVGGYPLPFSNAEGSMLLALHPMFTPQMSVFGNCWTNRLGSSPSGFRSNKTFETLTFIRLDCSYGTFQVGTEVKIWGCK